MNFLYPKNKTKPDIIFMLIFSQHCIYEYLHNIVTYVTLHTFYSRNIFYVYIFFFLMKLLRILVKYMTYYFLSSVFIILFA